MAATFALPAHRKTRQCQTDREPSVLRIFTISLNLEGSPELLILVVWLIHSSFVFNITLY